MPKDTRALTEDERKAMVAAGIPDTDYDTPSKLAFIAGLRCRDGAEPTFKVTVCKLEGWAEVHEWPDDADGTYSLIARKASP